LSADERPVWFQVANLDVDRLHDGDGKVRALWRRVAGDEAVMARCLAAHEATFAKSWKTGRRVTLEEAAPFWLSDLDQLLDVLAAVELLDAEGRIPEASWERWYGPARDRVLRKRQGGLAGAIGRWHAPNAGTPMAMPSDSNGTSMPRKPATDTDTDVEKKTSPPPPAPVAERGPRSNGTSARDVGSNPRAVGSNPRAVGTSTRQQRQAAKTGPTRLDAVFAGLAARGDGRAS
jgi:hypothetical protein